MTQTAAENLQTCALIKNDNSRLSGYVSGVEWDAIVAVELRYHQSSYAFIYQKQPAIERIKRYIPKVV